MEEYISIDYFTYNKISVVASIIIIILFILFVSIMTMALKYELYNKMNFCDPAFYYSKACNNTIAKTIIDDEKYKANITKFSNNINNNVNQIIADSQNAIDKNESTIVSKEEENLEFATESINQIQEITDNLRSISSKHLGNFNYLKDLTIEQSNNLSQIIQNIPSILKIIQEQVNIAVITPALTKMLCPLQKLYKSIQGVQSDSYLNSYISQYIKDPLPNLNIKQDISCPA